MGLMGRTRHAAHESHGSHGSHLVGGPSPGPQIVLVKNTASHAQGLEGSRFTRWQLYRLLAGGSRELPSAMFCPSRLFCCGDKAAHRTAAPRDVPGSRLLLTHRAATLRSGSPPGVKPLYPLRKFSVFLARD
jgi:hypothetical protein